MRPKNTPKVNTPKKTPSFPLLLKVFETQKQEMDTHVDIAKLCLKSRHELSIALPETMPPKTATSARETSTIIIVISDAEITPPIADFAFPIFWLPVIQRLLQKVAKKTKEKATTETINAEKSAPLFQNISIAILEPIAIPAPIT